MQHFPKRNIVRQRDLRWPVLRMHGAGAQGRSSHPPLRLARPCADLLRQEFGNEFSRDHTHDQDPIFALYNQDREPK